MSLSKQSAQTLSVGFTDKFSKELVKFMTWADATGFKISKGETECAWSSNLLKGFEEPGRNKLEGYVKGLLKKYKITKNSEDFDDYKVITNDFKTNKPKRKRVEMSSDLSSASDADIYTDESIDTSSTYYLATLDFTTEQLIDKLGQPLVQNAEKNKYEWKICIGKNVYSVYDWINEDNEFEDLAVCTWHFGGNSSNARDLKSFIKYMGGVKKVQKKIIKVEDSDSEDSSVAEEAIEEQLELKDDDMAELFGDTIEDIDTL